MKRANARSGVSPSGRSRTAPQELVLERVHALVDEILFRREVVEDGLLGDVGGAGHLGDADLLEAALEEETLRRLGDRPAGLMLFPLSKAQFGVHVLKG